MKKRKSLKSKSRNSNRNNNRSRSRSKSRNSNRNSNRKNTNNSKKCPPNMNMITMGSEKICVGRCPHSGGLIYYDPKADKLICKLHGSMFTKKGKVLTPPAMSNLTIKKLN